MLLGIKKGVKLAFMSWMLLGQAAGRNCDVCFFLVFLVDHNWKQNATPSSKAPVLMNLGAMIHG